MSNKHKTFRNADWQVPYPRNGGGDGGSGIQKVTYLKVFPVYQVFPLLKDPLGTVEKRGREREKCNCRRERKINGNIHVYLPFRVSCSMFQKALEFLSRLSAHISNSLWHPFTFFSSPPSPRLPSGDYLDTSTALASPSDNFGTQCSTLLQIPVFHFFLSLSLFLCLLLAIASNGTSFPGYLVRHYLCPTNFPRAGVFGQEIARG